VVVHDARVTSLPLSTVVATSAAVAATRSRKEKTAQLAAVLSATTVTEAALVVSLLAGDLRQGRVGIGWATLGRLEHDAAAESTLTVTDVDTTVDSVAAMTGPGSTRRRADILRELYDRATAAEADFLKRLMLGELRQGANEGLVIEGLAKASGIKATVVRRALMLSGDLGIVAEAALGGGTEALAAIRLEVGRPLRPMLASTAVDVAEAVDALGSVSVEWKLDGARIQVHRSGTDVGIWTRNLNEITDRIPGVVDIVRSFQCEDIVLDGEVLGFADDQEPQAFQDTMSSFGASTRETRELRPFFFDILHLDGTDLVDQPLAVRRRMLEGICGPHTVPGVSTEDPVEAEAVLRTALDRGHEGVMVKARQSRYEAGRRGKTWRKVKPVHTLDLVVLAAEWGHGRRQGWLSNLHLGARGADGEFVMVGKTFKGLTDQLLEWQTAQFLQRRIDEDGITVRVEPDMVVEVALDGVQSSTRYRGGVALRFARVKQYRPDKRPDEADTIAAVQALL
jgi:DNA ligase-1